jgi:hypothetical protein
MSGREVALSSLAGFAPVLMRLLPVGGVDMVLPGRWVLIRRG